NKVTIIIDEQAGTEKGLILNDSPLLPLRAIVTQLGVSNDDKHIIWNAEEKSVTIIKDTNEYHLKIGSNQALINKTPITMPETTVLENGLTYIPAAFIEKSLSDHVSWEPSEKRVNITSSNSEKAVAVLKSLETGDTQAIKRFISPVTYIQHNLAFPDGRDGLLQGLEFLKAAGFKINIQRVIVDGDYVAV
ncbi:stalk domain-containing protein, partial [Paenibacillus sp. TAF58]